MSNKSETTNLYHRLKQEVHVWYCVPSVIVETSTLADYKSLLSRVELDRYHCIRSESDKKNYLVAHALLRQALSRYVDLPASNWQFEKNKHQKPVLSSAMQIYGLQFNLTHTKGLCACVISLRKRCGIDAEHIHRKSKLEAIAQRMFADEELALIDDGNTASKFYYYWTLREAYVKALGTGIAGFSKQFYFEIDSDKQAAKIHYKKKQDSDDKNWGFKLYQPTADHLLAVACESYQNERVLLFDWCA